LELNRYGYTANNPVNRWDPSGLFESAGLYDASTRNSIEVGSAIGGAALGLLSSFFFYTTSMLGQCGDMMYEAMSRTDPVKFALLSGFFGGAFAYQIAKNLNKIPEGPYKDLALKGLNFIGAVTDYSAATQMGIATGHHTPCSTLALAFGTSNLMGAVSGGGPGGLGGVNLYSLAGGGGTGGGAVALTASATMATASFVGGALGVLVGYYLSQIDPWEDWQDNFDSGDEQNGSGSFGSDDDTSTPPGAKTPEGVFTSFGDNLPPGGGTSGSGDILPDDFVTLYRAVDDGEALDLMETGTFRGRPHPSGFTDTMDTKWFVYNLDDAHQFGLRLHPDGKYNIIEIRVPKHVADSGYIADHRLDGIGPGVALEPEDINAYQWNLIYEWH
jgi:hypothetical protein